MRLRATSMAAIRNAGRRSPSQQIAAMFANGLKGIWRESSRSGTLFVESTGVTPVTAAGNPIGFVRSLDQGGGRGPEIAVNGNFATDSSWVKGVGWSISGGRAIRAVAAFGSVISQSTGQLIAGKSYEIQFDYYSVTPDTIISGSLRGGTLVNAGTAVSGDGHYRNVLVAATGNTSFEITVSTANSSGEFDNFSIKEVPGNHQLQATTQSRPLYQVGPPRPVYDGVDDSLVTTFPVALGANCTVGRYVPGTGVVISEGVNIGTTFSDDVTSGPLLVGDRALTANEKTVWAAYLTQQGTLP